MPADTHSYVSAGTYTVSLTVSGPGGSDTHTQTDYITVSDPTVISAFSATPLLGFSPLAVDFTDASTGNIATHSWDFGDGATSSEVSPTHSYVSAGTYTVSLTVSGPGGSDTHTQTDYITVSDPTVISAFSATPLLGFSPLAVDFTDASTGNIATHSWDFGDGATSSEVSPTHSYVSAGTYTVSLTVSGPGGSDTHTQTDYITVSDPTVISAFSATPLLGFSPLAVDFTDASTGNIATHSWDFGDGATSSEVSPTHSYVSAGTYTVSLTVSGPGGSDTHTQIDYITVSDPTVISAFSATPLLGFSPLAVDFTDASTGNIATHSWDFGDGATSSEVSPT